MKGSIWFLAGVVSLAACSPRVQEVRLDPMEFQTHHGPDGTRVDLLDPDVLFQEGAAAFEDKRHDDAVRKFGLILSRFPDSRFAKPATYNHGLALLAAGRPGEAARDFQDYLRRWPDDAEQADVWQRLGQASLESGDWARAEEALRRRVALPMTLAQEVENRARLTRALRMQGRYEEARDEVAVVMRLHDRNATLPEMQSSYFVAMASFEGAQAYHDLFSRIKFVLPTERMEKDLTDKATLFLKAQSEYLRTVRMRNVYWGVQAGIRVGRLYEEFYEDIMNAEVPTDLDADELKIYMDELKKKARPLVAKAVDAYERNLSMARLYGAQDEWFGDMAARLGKLRKVLADTPEATE